MQKCRWSLLLTALVSLTWVLQDCSLETKEQGISRGRGYYAIEAQTILESLDRGEMDVFAPQLATPETTPADLLPVQWSQADYYRIAQTFHQFVWQDPMESWELYDLFFRLDCEYASLGPQYASFTLFKTVRVRERDSRLERTLFIKPLQNQIWWIETEYYPDVFSLSPLDLSQIKIPAETALQIAERHGGQEARLAAANECLIFEQLVAGVRDNNWRVSYSAGRETTLFEVHIDEQTGEYTVIHSEAE